MESSSWKPIQSSITSKRTTNPIRAIVDNLKVEPNKNKAMISLALGDPTIFGNFKTPSTCVDTLIKQLQSYKANGYPPSVGYEYAREAIAKKFSHPNAPLQANDIIIASGCSGALDLCVSVLCNEGQNLLVPRPGFPLYQTLAESKGVEIRYYNLLPDRNWEIDLEHITSLIDSKTAAIVVNNPSNPCGSVFSKDHLKSILGVAEQFHVPLIADEIYADMAFKPFQFIPLASLTTTVPILTAGGLAKQYLVPGWRVGWILIHDRNGLFAEVRKGLNSLSQLILGANSLVQSAIPNLLLETPQSFYDETLSQLETNAALSRDMIQKIKGLKIVIPQGAMYMMVGIDTEQFNDIDDDLTFTEKLVAEESVLCLPGSCFKYPNYFRIVFTAPKDKLSEAYQRIEAFCERHHLLISAEKPVTPDKLLQSARYAARELPIRLAKRVQSMQQLPFIVGLNPHIRKIYVLYQHSFEKIRTFQEIKTLDDDKEFTELLSELVESHTHVIPSLAHGIQECKRYMNEDQVTDFLDKMIQARIGIRVIAEHHLALHEDVENYSGIINHKLSPHDIIEKCAPYAQDLSEANFGSFPEFKIDGHVETTFPYIDVHLEYMIFELLKNAFRATVEFTKKVGRVENPPIEITIGRGTEDVTIRIRDQGGGIPKEKLKSAWKYSFSTIHEQSSDDGFLSEAARMGVITGTGGPMAGLGYGLPMSRIYARWAGGSLELVSLEDYGCDVFLRLPFIREISNLQI